MRSSERGKGIYVRIYTMDKVGHVTCFQMRREGIGCLLKMSLVSVLLENSLVVSTSRDFFPLFHPSLRRHPETQLPSEYKFVEKRRRRGQVHCRQREGSGALSEEIVGETPASPSGISKVCVHGAVRLENMHLHGASASLHAPASSLTLQEFLLAWKIPAPPFPSEFSSPNWPETIRPNVEHATVCRRREEGNETYLLQTCSFLIFLLPFSSITDDFMRC